MIILIVLVPLIGCQKKITTFDEIIANDKVEIDGTTYNITSTNENYYEYDVNDNVISMKSIYGNKVQTIEFMYEDNLLVKEKRYSSLNSDILYYYNTNNKLIKTEQVTDDGLKIITEYSYNENKKKTIHRNSNGDIEFYSEATVDEKGNVLTYTSYDASGNKKSFGRNFYENDQLITSINETVDGDKVTHYYEYNNIGDKIFWYVIHHGEKPRMNVAFFEYEYNENYLPIKTKIYKVNSFITPDKIRNYWE